MTCAKFKDLYKRSDLDLQKQGDKRNNMQNSKQPNNHVLAFEDGACSVGL